MNRFVLLASTTPQEKGLSQRKAESRVSAQALRGCRLWLGTPPSLCLANPVKLEFIFLVQDIFNLIRRQATMVTRITRSWWMFALRGGIAVAFGVVALALPDITLEVLVTLFGAVVLADGNLCFRHGNDGRRRPLWGLGVPGRDDRNRRGNNRSGVAGDHEFELLYVIAVSAVISGIFEILAGINLRTLTQGAEWLILSGAFSVAVGRTCPAACRKRTGTPLADRNLRCPLWLPAIDPGIFAPRYQYAYEAPYGRRLGAGSQLEPALLRY